MCLQRSKERTSVFPKEQGAYKCVSKGVRSYNPAYQRNKEYTIWRTKGVRSIKVCLQRSKTHTTRRTKGTRSIQPTYQRCKEHTADVPKVQGAYNPAYQMTTKDYEISMHHNIEEYRFFPSSYMMTGVNNLMNLLYNMKINHMTYNVRKDMLSFIMMG